MHFEIPTLSGQFILTINRNDILIFIGSNGTGKTRLGLFLENHFFQVNAKNIKKAEYQINKNKRELNNKSYYLDSDADELSKIESMDEDKILTKAKEYCSQIVANTKDGRAIDNLELAKMAISGELDHVSLENLQTKTDSPQETSLKDYIGQIVVAENYVIEVDLLNATESDKLSIERAKNCLIDKQKLQIRKRKRYFDVLENNTIKLEESIKNYAVSEFSYCERISAHRSLVLQEKFTPKDLVEAENELHFGKSVQADDTTSKWGKRPLGGIQSDFDKLMTAFLSEEADSGARFRQQPESPAPTTNLDKALKIWNKLLPHRKLEIQGLKIHVSSYEKEHYPISDLSEGERTLFYIMGKCLFAKNNSLIIIDEPDIHIHKAILPSFFDEIERERNDCAFIYITHDLNFVESRSLSRKYVLNSYKYPDKWDIQDLPSTDVPESLYGLVCGSRKNVLFVEGSERNNSLDTIFKHIYKDFKVIPVGNCELVKSYVRSMNFNIIFHRVKCFGIIDRDDLSESNIDTLKNDSIYSLPVAIIENLFLLPEIAKQIFRIVGAEDKYDKSEFSQKVIEWIEANDDWKAKSIKQRLIKHCNTEIGRLPSKFSVLASELRSTSDRLVLESILTSFNQDYEKRLARAKLENNPIYLLEVCRGKTLLPKFSQYLGLGGNAVLESRILKNICRDECLVNSLKLHLPKIGD